MDEGAWGQMDGEESGLGGEDGGRGGLSAGVQVLLCGGGKRGVGMEHREN